MEYSLFVILNEAQRSEESQNEILRCAQDDIWDFINFNYIRFL
jgi:hypothetical protein